MEYKKRNDFKVLTWSVIGFALIIIITASLEVISPDQALGLFFSAVLVTVTIWYAANTKRMAKSANEQAEASVKMAEETRKQRYASVRPVIDIKIKELRGKYLFLLDNIGIGPATDVRSGFADIDRKGIQFLSIGALKAGAAFPEEFELPIKNKGDKTSVFVIYKDIYDQSFESTRNLEMTATGLDMGYLIVKRLSTTEGTFND